MPTNLVKSKQDEEDWAEARRIVDKQYPDKSPDDKDKSYWKLTTSIYENIKKNRGKKQMQKQASVGALLAGRLKLRKQADDNRRRGGWRPSGGGGVVTADKITGGDGVVTADKINGGGYVDTLEYRGPGFVKRGGRWVQVPDAFERYPTPTRPPAPAPNWYPMPKWSPQPSPPPRFPIPRGIRGPWGRPDEQPNDPMENERIRRLVEGNNPPAPGGGMVGRPVDESEIPLPSQDPGGAPPAPKNTPPVDPPKMTKEELNRIMRETFKRPHYDPGWNNEPGWYERIGWPNRYPEVEQPSNEWEWPYDRWGRPRGEWGRIYDKWFWPEGQYYHRGRGRNGEIDPRGINIPPDAWYQGRTLPPMSVRDMQY